MSLMYDDNNDNHTCGFISTKYDTQTLFIHVQNKLASNAKKSVIVSNNKCRK